MPKSKRNRIVTLNKVTKKGRPRKEGLVDQIRDCLQEFEHVWVLSYENMRNQPLKEVREEWSDSRFFFGKNKVMQLALGRSVEEEALPGLSRLAERIKGFCGLLFTNKTIEETTQYFSNFGEDDYARAGSIANETVELDAGELTQFVHSQEPYLRDKLHMPVKLVNGKVTLRKPYTVCTEGEELSPEQGKLLQLLDIKMSKFKLLPVCRYQISINTFTSIIDDTPE